MNRQEAIEILTGRYLIPVEDGADEHAERVNKALDLAIDALNIIEQLRWERDTALQTLEEHGIGLGQKSDWIPVSERLPEDDALMIVTFKPNRPDEGDVWIGWHEMENVWFIDGEEHSKEHGNEVIAWKPLPEPYKESE